MTNYNDGKWHGWNGGECPLHPKTKGIFVFADGTVCHRKPAGTWDWNTKLLPIIAFRVTKAHREPMQFWAIPVEWIAGEDTEDGEDDWRWMECGEDVPECVLFREVLE